MIKQEKLLYELSNVWDQEMQLGQKNLIQAIIDFFPQDIGSALDVGCGDGKLTEVLIKETKCNISGVDASKEALSRCDFDTTHANAEELPFANDAYDLVYSLDMVEHIPDGIVDKVWDQFFRVAKKWVMVATPFRENLMEATAKCSYCGESYHVNWHLRSYDWPEMVSRCPNDFEESF